MLCLRTKKWKFEGVDRWLSWWIWMLICIAGTLSILSGCLAIAAVYIGSKSEPALNKKIYMKKGELKNENL
jgi:hypothetical protein